MTEVYFFLMIGLIMAWAYTSSRLHEKISSLEISMRFGERRLEQVYEAINGNWSSRDEFEALLNDLPALYS